MKHILFLLLFFKTFFTFSNDTLELKKSIPIQAYNFTTDPLGNIYIVKSNNAVLKFSNTGDSLTQFNEIKKGKITQIDATNPLRILVYYGDYSQIILLDNLMSLKSQIRLNTPSLINAPCVSNSADGGIWIYDQAATIQKINEQLEAKFSLSLINVFDKILSPNSITEQDRNLFIVDSLNGIYRFDQLGLFKLNYPFQTKEIQYFSPYLVYYQKPYLISYNTESFIEKKIILPHPEDIFKVRMEKNSIYILRSDRLDIYNLD